MCEIKCPYKDKCTSHPHNCGSCSRNTSKRDYYRPRRRDWYTPYYPWQPYTVPYVQPYWQYTWSIAGDNHTPTWNTSTTAAGNTWITANTHAAPAIWT